MPMQYDADAMTERSMDLLGPLARMQAYRQRHHGLQADIIRLGSAYRIVVDAPGADPDATTIEYVDDGLDITIVRSRSLPAEYKRRLDGRADRIEGHITLPAAVTVDPDTASATITDRGTLEITLPHSEHTD